MLKAMLIGLLLIASAVYPRPLSAFIPSVSRSDADHALKIAKSPLAAREAFSSRYNIAVLAPTIVHATINRIEILTEFRRMEQIAEQRLAVDPTFGAGGEDEMMAAIQPWRDQLSVIVHIQLGPSLLWAPSSPTTVSIDDEMPLKVHGFVYGGGKGPPTAEDVELTFDAARITSTVHTITVEYGGVVVIRREVDFGAFE